MFKRGQTARDMAIERNELEVAAYLEEQMRLVSELPNILMCHYL